MDTPNSIPELKKTSFSCPHCGAFAHMAWWFAATQGLGPSANWFWMSRCSACKKDSVWDTVSHAVAGTKEHSQTGTLVYPRMAQAPGAHPDMPEDIKADFEEARQIAGISPRGAAALLRLCIQKICIKLGHPGKNINHDIAAMVAAGLPPRVQEALDVVRVVGNNAVHPGEMTPEDTHELAQTLFELVNLIVDVLIAQPARVSAVYARLPQKNLQAIAKRDGATS